MQIDVKKKRKKKLIQRKEKKNCAHTLSQRKKNNMQLETIKKKSFLYFFFVDGSSVRNYLNRISSKSNGYSIIPVVGTRTRRMSCSVGR